MQTCCPSTVAGRTRSTTRQFDDDGMVPVAEPDTVVKAPDETADACGREADAPTELRTRGWSDVLRRSARQIKQDNLPILAAGVAFWFFLALVPTIVAVINVYGIVADPADVTKLVSKFDQALPRDLVRFINDQLDSVTRTSNSKLGLGLALAVVAALWSASKGMRTLIEATNAAYDEEESRSFIKIRLLALAFTAAGVVVGVGGMIVIGIGPRLASHLGPAGTVVSIVLGLAGGAGRRRARPRCPLPVGPARQGSAVGVGHAGRDRRHRAVGARIWRCSRCTPTGHRRSTRRTAASVRSRSCSCGC